MRPPRPGPRALRACLVLGALGAALLAAPPPALAGAPAWLQELAKRPTPAVAPEAPAVVLLDETVTVVDDSGTANAIHRMAVRILKKSGAEHANGSIDYVDKQDKVRSCQAWLLRGAKVVKSVGTRDWLDIAAVESGAVYSDYRHRLIDLKSEVEIGDVFGFETQVDSRLLFAQLGRRFGSMLPVVLERFQLRVPAGFHVEEVVVGPARLTAAAAPDGLTRTWTLVDRPYRREESWAADGNFDEPTLLLNLVPPAGLSRFRPAVIRSWQEAVAWDLRLNAAQRAPDAALSATVTRLVTGCPDTPAKIRALANFAQQIRYIEVARDLGKGLGYRARPAAEVLSKGFGDCKDKANLLCTLLREIGVNAYAVGVLADESRHVEPGWPSLAQFNHAIAAIEVDDSVDLPPIVRTEKWGRLLLFDPTAENVPFGSLPWILQGTKGELVAAGSSELIDLPRMPATRAWARDRRVRLDLARNGAVTGVATVRDAGEAAADLRAQLQQLSEKELLEAAVKRLKNTVHGVIVSKAVREDLLARNEYGLTFEFTARAFVQLPQSANAVARLDLLNRDSIPQFPEKTRRTPVRLRPMNFYDEVTLRLPEGLGVAELPPKTRLQTPFGTHEASFEFAAGTVTFRRTFVLKDRTVPVEEYPALQRFLADAARAERAAVLLRPDSAD